MTGVKRIRLSAKRRGLFFNKGDDGQRIFTKDAEWGSVAGGGKRRAVTIKWHQPIFDLKRNGPVKTDGKKQAPFTFIKLPTTGVRTTEIQSDRGKIVDNGQVNMSKLSIRGSNYEIPTFDYIIIKRKPDDGTPAGWVDGRYIATCVNLKMDGYGSTPFKAWCDMNINVREYIYNILEHYDYSHTALENAFKQGRNVPHSSSVHAEA